MNTCVRFVLLVLSIALLPGAARAVDFTAPLQQKPPVLDGKVNPEEWSGAVRIDGFGADPRQASGYVMATSTHIYLAVVSQLPVKGDILAEVDKNTSKMVHDDSIEIWIDPDPDAAAGARVQMMTNYLGRTWGRKHYRGGVKEDLTWTPEFTVKSGKHDGAWHCEIALPVAQFGKGRTAEAGTWSIDLWRNWKRPWKQAFMGVGTWRFADKAAPVVRLIEKGNRSAGQVHAVLQMVNPSNDVVQLKAHLRAARDVMPAIDKEQSLELAPGKTAELVIEESDQNTKKWTLTARVSSGGTTVFDHSVTFGYAGRFVWEAVPKEIVPVDFLFNYWPSANRMRIMADVTNMPADARLDKLTATVRNKKTGEVAKAVTFDDLQGGKQTLVFDMPELEGEYDIVMRATGANVPDKPRVKSFIRNRYAWEGAGYGITDKVYPPFTEMKLEGRTVETVLRRHTYNDYGLWDQVNCQVANTGTRKDLLASPMRYAATVGGKDIKLAPTRFQVVGQSGSVVKAKAGFAGEGVSATANITWEYDGMMKVELTLDPTAGKPVDALRLEIPMKADQAAYIHALGDGIRNSVNLELPVKGRSEVLWTSEGIPRDDLPPNFCSYIFLGTPLRGLCWFTENDLGMSLDRGKPNMRIVRRGGTHVLQVDFINTPTLIDKPRTIVFGLQAAPVKPRLDDDWRLKWQRDDYTGVLTSVNWGSFSAAASHYPIGKDLLIWEKFKKSNLEGGLPRDEIAKVVEHYRQGYMQPYKDLRWRQFTLDDFVTRHMYHNLGGGRSHKELVFYWNRATCLNEDEFLTFQDEWGLHNWRPDYDAQGKQPHHEIKIVPTDTYCDFAIYWYRKSFEAANNKGVYWDNMFFRGSYNTRFTRAYEKGDGSVAASTGIWGLREIVKRTFQDMASRGMKPITMPHMTSTMILPVYAHATVIYDLEWKYGKGMFQDKFPRPYTLMATTGELCGAWPIMLGDRGYKEDYRIPRSYTGSLLVHDVYWLQDRAGAALMKPVWLILEEPGVKVYREYDDVPLPFDVTRQPGDLHHIAYVVPGKRALLAITSYSKGQRQPVIKLNREVLGMKGKVTVRDAETLRGFRLGDDDTFGDRIPSHATRLYEVIAGDAPTN